MTSGDWNKARNLYVTTDKTVKDIAKKFDVSERTVWRRYTKENWKQLRADYVSKLTKRCQEKTVEKTAEKQAETFADYAVELRQDIIDINRMLTKKIRETMAYSDAFSPRDLKSLSSMLQDLMINEEKMTAQDQSSGSGDTIQVEFVNNIWDEEGKNA